MPTRNKQNARWKEYDIARIRELALSAVPQSVIVTDGSDPAYPIIYANDAFTLLTGYDGDEILGRNCNFLAGPNTSTKLRADIRQAIEERTRFRGTVINYRKDGSQFWNDLTIIPITDGADRYFVGVQRDVTEQLTLEASLRESQKMEALGKLSGGIAHDFNNLLALIMGNAEIIAGENASPIASEAVRDILAAADDGAELIARMLSFAGGQTEANTTVDVNHLVRNVTMLLGRTIGDGIKIAMDLSEAVQNVQANKTLFRTALINLVLNARDAMPDGGTIRVSTRRRTQAATNVGECVVISVSDTGTGMDKATVEQAFEPFFTTKTVGRGTGLGLSMVYRFVKQSGGDVQISSQPGKGSIVRLILPLEDSGSLERGAQSAVSSQHGRVLIVEDDPKLRKMLAMHLQRAGYAIDEAANAQEALDVADNTNDLRLVISDIRLGEGMTGIDLVAAIRARRPGMPMLLITAYADELAASPSHIDGVPILRKPFRTGEMIDMVAQMLNGLSLVSDSGRG